MEDRVGRDVQRQQAQAGAQDGAHDLVQFKRVHRVEAPNAARRRSQRTCGGGWITRLPAPLATRITGAPTRLFDGFRPATRRSDRPNSEPMADSDVLIVIPARMASTRLPGKPLADIAGTPMIVHVLRRAQAADAGDGRGGDRFRGDRRLRREGRRPRGDDPRRPRLGLRPHLRGARERRPGGRAAASCVNVQGDLPTHRRRRHPRRARAARRSGGRHRHAGGRDRAAGGAHQSRTW